MKTKEELQNFLEMRNVAVLATSIDNKPNAATIYYYIDKNLIFYFATKNQTKKYANMKENNSVALVITDEDRLETVQLEGYAYEIADPQELIMAINNVSKSSLGDDKSVDELPISRMKKGESRFFKIKPQWIRWIAFKDGSNIVQFEEDF